MTLCTDKDLKSKNVRGKKYISQGYRFKRKFEIKAKKVFLGHPNSGRCIQNA